MKTHASLVCMVLMLVIVTIAALCIGTNLLSPLAMLELLARPDSQDFVLWQHRIPRTLIAALVGSAIGVAGALVQGVIRNPLASPDILGVTQGAGLAVSVVLLLLPNLPPVWLPVFACIGGAAGAGLLLAYNAGTTFSPVRFAVSGVAVSLCFASSTEFLLLTYPVEINTALMALTGSLWARGWTHVGLALLLVPFMLAALPLAKHMDLIGLGEEAAVSLGSNLTAVRIGAITLAVVLSGIAVSIVGPISFVGLLAPHLARRLVGGRSLALIPASALVGAIVVIGADTLGRGIAPPLDIPAGILTAVVGAPYFLWLLFRIR